MFIPVHTDAPLYHRPIGTVGLIFANIAAFVATSGGEQTQGWLLTFDNGLHPAEWIPSAFLHFGVVHLIGNMVFLWAFGLLIEGKLGLLRFLALYFSLCILDGLLAQTLMLFSLHGGGAGGASGVLFGMMVICLLWAPRNSFDVVWLYRLGPLVRGGAAEMSVISLAMFYLGLNFLYAWMKGFSMSSEVLHLIGAAAGLPVGLLCLRYRWVDCEGWDLLTLWKKDLLQPGAGSLWGWKGKTSAEVDRPVRTVKQSDFRRQLRKIERQIDEGQAEAALAGFCSLPSDWRSQIEQPVPRIRKLIDAASKAGQWKEAAELIESNYLPLQPGDETRARLMLAGILVRHLHRPRSALRQLEAISGLTDESLLQKIRAAAQAQIDEGVVEVSLTDAVQSEFRPIRKPAMH
ncbi:rhomboid family intramembrane serine protease [Planctomicrobium piriforme]|uniref:Membrane associated serine protease, rhomboid family n=1 Tax=Planctomicrobium piriforme TaxID=1576369 RepID=A0A1I3K3H3_9PLAN|nr:rhomboid family intramembrane serine protease [Planctomicrobium piriforme]SFI67069.1 Membrane associated serine protease, rhomboid family [Planctomicrobium piriforme]